MPENCNSQDCPVMKRVEGVAEDVRSLDQKLSIFQRSTGDSISSFGKRLGHLEAHNEVQDEKITQIKEIQADVKKSVEDARQEQRVSISDLKTEQGKAMAELKDNYAKILDAVTPVKHKVESMEAKQKELSADVDEIKEKPAKTWEDIKSKALGWAVAVILAIIGAALGLSKFL